MKIKTLLVSMAVVLIGTAVCVGAGILLGKLAVYLPAYVVTILLLIFLSFLVYMLYSDLIKYGNKNTSKASWGPEVGSKVYRAKPNHKYFYSPDYWFYDCDILDEFDFPDYESCQAFCDKLNNALGPIIEDITVSHIPESDMDKAEEKAIQRAEDAAYKSTENANPQVQTPLYTAMKEYMCTGIRLMREEVSNMAESNYNGIK